jgi:hypothetical protein
MVRTETKIAALFLGLGLLANPFFARDERFLVPSRMFHTEDWSVRYWDYLRSEPRSSVLLLGNSRTLHGLRPWDVQAALERAGVGLKVHSLATGGGFPPFYDLLVRRMIPKDKLPRAVILGLSPRDVNRLEGRAKRNLGYLTGSPAYQARFTDTLNRAEIALRDFYASALPLVYFKTELREMMFGYRSLPWNSGSGTSPALQRYSANLAKLWTFDVDGYLRSFAGKPIVDPDFSPDAKAKYREEIAEWLSSPRGGSKRLEPVRSFEVDGRSDSELRRLLGTLEAWDIPVVLTVPPAIRLEDYENNLQVYEAFLESLAGLRRSRRNVLAVVDLNEKFDHEFLDASLYTDGEHATEEGSRLFSARLIERLKADPDLLTRIVAQRK